MADYARLDAWIAAREYSDHPAILEAGGLGPAGCEDLVREQAKYDPERRASARVEAAPAADELPDPADIRLLTPASNTLNRTAASTDAKAPTDFPTAGGIPVGERTNGSDARSIYKRPTVWHSDCTSRITSSRAGPGDPSPGCGRQDRGRNSAVRHPTRTNSSGGPSRSASTPGCAAASTRPTS